LQNWQKTIHCKNILLKGKRSRIGGVGREGEGRKVEGKWYPHFLRESYATAVNRPIICGLEVWFD